MSHIHIPDGVLPFWLWGLGYLLLILLLLILFRFKNKRFFAPKAVNTGIFAAIMLAAMSFFVIPPFYHFTLASLAGIILGPSLALPAIFSVNIFLALLGHGGISVIGLNTLVLYLEAVLAYTLTRSFYKTSKKLFASAFLASVIALIISLALKTSIVYAGTRDFHYVIGHNHESQNKTVEEEYSKQEFDIKKFFLLLFSFGIFGWLSESFITAFIINYLYKVRPGLLKGITDEDI